MDKNKILLMTLSSIALLMAIMAVILVSTSGSDSTSLDGFVVSYR